MLEVLWYRDVIFYESLFSLSPNRKISLIFAVSVTLRMGYIKVIECHLRKVQPR